MNYKKVVANLLFLAAFFVIGSISAGIFPIENLGMLIVIAILGIAFFFFIIWLVGSALQTKTAEKIMLNEAAWSINANNEIGKKGSEADRALIMEYMRRNNILSCVLDGTIWNYEVEKVKELPADLRVRKILIAMDYLPDNADRIIHKAKVTLGEKCRFDEMLKFCLEA